MKYAPKTGNKRRYDLGERQRGQPSVGKVAFLCPETLECHCQCPSIAPLIAHIVAKDSSSYQPLLCDTSVYLSVNPVPSLSLKFPEKSLLTHPSWSYLPCSVQHPQGQYEGTPSDGYGHCPFCAPVHTSYVRNSALSFRLTNQQIPRDETP